MVFWDDGDGDGLSHTAANPPQLKLNTTSSIINQTASPTQLHQFQHIHTFFSSDAVDEMKRSHIVVLSFIVHS